MFTKIRQGVKKIMSVVKELINGVIEIDEKTKYGIMAGVGFTIGIVSLIKYNEVAELDNLKHAIKVAELKELL